MRMTRFQFLIVMTIDDSFGTDLNIDLFHGELPEADVRISLGETELLK